MIRVIRVIIVDDEPMVCAHLRVILGAAGDIEVVADANDGAEAVEAVIRHRPDVVLMDLRMPGVGGLTAIERIAAMPGPPAVVALTTFDEDSSVLRAMHAGAAGFLLKSTPPEDLVELMRVAAAGHTVMSPAATARLVSASSAGRRRDETAKARLRELTERELDVLTQLGHGRSNADIARHLHLAEATVKSYVSRMLVKLDCRNRTQAGLLAHEAGLVNPN